MPAVTARPDPLFSSAPAVPGALPHPPASALPDRLVRLTRVLAVGSLLGLILLGLAWELWLAPTGQRTWALKVLPLAFPAYVLAYAYTDFLSHPGPVQSALRGATGWGPRDYWFPNIRSLPGAALMLVCVYYPYVYLLARTAFAQQSATAWLAARTLGQGPWRAFRFVRGKTTARSL